MRYGVILAGGGGTRLWPASRRARPKQLLPLVGGGESLLAASVRRARQVCDAVVIVTAAEQAPLIPEALDGSGGPIEILREPVGRNTAAAIGLAAVHLAARDPDAVLGVFPADHHVADEERFAVALERAFDLATSRRAIVTLGVVPTRPDTAYGYLELGAAVAGDSTSGSGTNGAHPPAREVVRFVEKPAREAAEAMVAGGQHLWNAGIFIAPAGRLLADLDRHMPDTGRALGAIAAALASGGPATAEARAAELYPALPPVSIDYGVIERLDDLLCVPGDFGWNDVGSWSSLADIARPDVDGNVSVGGHLVAVDARDNIAVGEAGQVIALIGVEGLVVVRSGDAVLVVPRERAQEVREAVQALERAGLGRFL